jgi:hypothetical protein
LCGLLGVLEGLLGEGAAEEAEDGVVGGTADGGAREQEVVEAVGYDGFSNVGPKAASAGCN